MDFQSEDRHCTSNNLKNFIGQLKSKLTNRRQVNNLRQKL